MRGLFLTRCSNTLAPGPDAHLHTLGCEPIAYLETRGRVWEVRRCVPQRYIFCGQPHSQHEGPQSLSGSTSDSPRLRHLQHRDIFCSTATSNPHKHLRQDGAP